MSTYLNLLPPERRKILATRKIMVRVNTFLMTIIWSLTFITCIGVGSIVILRYLESKESDAAEDNLAKATAAYTQLRQDIGQKNALLDGIADVSAMKLSWSTHIADLVRIIPAGIRITSIQGMQDDTSFILFSGQAPTRNALILLEKQLHALSWVASLNAPNANLIDRVNAPYEFRLTLK